MNKFVLCFLLIFLSMHVEASNLRIKKFIPVGGEDMPAVILCPGGSYHYLGLRVEGSTIAKWLNKNGIAAFVLSYRVAPLHRYPSMVEDLQEAIVYCRQNSEKLGINAAKIGVIGFSAGGHLAGISAIYDTVNFIKGSVGISARPDFVAMIYPVVSMDDEDIVHEKSRRGLLGASPSAVMKDSLSLEKHVHASMPPLFLVHAIGDNVVDYRNSVNLSKQLERVGCRYKFLLYSTGTHGFGIDKSKGGEALGWNLEFLKWLKELKIDERFSSRN